MTDTQTTIEQLYNRIRQMDVNGPMHAAMDIMKADAGWFACAIVDVNGAVHTVGEAEVRFPLQSVSKVFTYGLALDALGREAVLECVGVEPTGRRYNAISLDEQTGRPYNPMVNAGAIAIAGLIPGESLSDRLNRVIDHISVYAGQRLTADSPTLAYEFEQGHRNEAIAHLMRAAGSLRGDIDEALHLYFNQCSLLVSTIELATMAATLANRGTNPMTAVRALKAEYVRDVLSVMHTCGMYDSSGEWAYRVGLPAKSGVSGGILAVVPGSMGIAVLSPPLNAVGHSIRGLAMFEALSSALNLHIFDAKLPIRLTEE